MNINILLFPDFEALDVFGPAEVLSKVEGYTLRYLSPQGGVLTNRQNIRILTEAITPADYGDIWLIPGGMGTRPLAADEAFLALLGQIVQNAAFVLSVCTGSALLAKCGALNGRRATTNRRAFDWVETQGPQVLWDRTARWTVDGKFFVSAGVSAGIDMALAFVAHQFGPKRAEEIAAQIEYRSWQEGVSHEDW